MLQKKEDAEFCLLRSCCKAATGVVLQQGWVCWDSLYGRRSLGEFCSQEHFWSFEKSLAWTSQVPGEHKSPALTPAAAVSCSLCWRIVNQSRALLPRALLHFHSPQEGNVRSLKTTDFCELSITYSHHSRAGKAHSPFNFCWSVLKEKLPHCFFEVWIEGTWDGSLWWDLGVDYFY